MQNKGQYTCILSNTSLLKCFFLFLIKYQLENAPHTCLASFGLLMYKIVAVMLKCVFPSKTLDESAINIINSLDQLISLLKLLFDFLHDTAQITY